MIEIGKTYTKPELSTVFGSRDKQGLERKMLSYQIGFSVSGRGEEAVYEIQTMGDPFKVFAITELGCGGNTSFDKLRNFYWYYFNDEIFMAMPDEVKEVWMKRENHTITRQTIASYTQKLVRKNMIDRNTKNFVYYFAFKGTQRFAEHAEYLQAWKEYWADINGGCGNFVAIANMRATYGGVARKQAIPDINGIYNKEIEYMLSAIQQSIENEQGE